MSHPPTIWYFCSAKGRQPQAVGAYVTDGPNNRRDAASRYAQFLDLDPWEVVELGVAGGTNRWHFGIDRKITQWGWEITLHQLPQEEV
jgi:hypothetical protein